jgi:hypothetical protein
MKTDTSISLDPEYNWASPALERINVNLSGVRVGSSWIQGFEWPMTEQPHVERTAPVGNLYSLSDVFRLVIISIVGPNLITSRFPAPHLGQSDPNAHLSESLAWMAFTREALKDSRPMTEWERKAAADFFWSEFD